VFNATFSNISAISWRPVLVVEEAGVRMVQQTIRKLRAPKSQICHFSIMGHNPGTYKTNFNYLCIVFKTFVLRQLQIEQGNIKFSIFQLMKGHKC